MLWQGPARGLHAYQGSKVRGRECLGCRGVPVTHDKAHNSGLSSNKRGELFSEPGGKGGGGSTNEAFPPYLYRPVCVPLVALMVEVPAYIRTRLVGWKVGCSSSGGAGLDHDVTVASHASHLALNDELTASVRCLPT